MAGTIGDTLKKLREAKGMSMAFVAKQLDLSLGAYQKYENNTRDVSTSTLNAIADFYGVTTDYLLGRPGAKPPEDPIIALCNAYNLPKEDRSIVAAYLYMSDKDRAELLRLIKKLVASQEQESEPIQQIKLVPHAARGGDKPDLIETTEEDDERLLKMPNEDWDL